MILGKETQVHGKHGISIWFFIGSLLTTYGVLVVGAELYRISNPPAREVVLANLHAGLWWGGLLLALGLLYVVRFRPGRE
jgi:hypothetical protein